MPLWGWVLSFYTLMSIITLIVYAWDKRKARLGEWRTRERTLHILALLGGWPGSFIAMRVVRHKNAKTLFVAITLAIAFVHAAVWGAILWTRWRG